jgi:hypothetical protein
MPVMFDDLSGGFVIRSDDCEDCGQPLYQSGCDAAGCDGLACQDCGSGCDYDFVDLEDGGRCATAREAESDEDYAERVNRERAAFGLSPITGDHP